MDDDNLTVLWCPNCLESWAYNLNTVLLTMAGEFYTDIEAILGGHAVSHVEDWANTGSHEPF